MQKPSAFMDWAVEQHTKTNHLYADQYPYSTHLILVAEQAENFAYILPDVKESVLLDIAFGHDLIEDARVTYNDIKKALKSFGYENSDIHIIAESCFFLTNLRGRNRSERASAEYYSGIRSMPTAHLIKICDRIANIEFSLGNTGDNNMGSMYIKEHPKFQKELYIPQFEPMFKHIETLFNYKF